jgi:hypothetical protein
MNMPPRQGAGLVPVDDGGITVGKVLVAGVGVRIAMLCDGRLVHMSPAAARRLAADFDTAEALAHDLGWIAETLRECADEIDAATATKQ